MRMTPTTYGAFLSTLSLRRATQPLQQAERACQHFYPRSPCGERQLPSIAPNQNIHISIHALLAESDLRFRRLRSLCSKFLSTLSLRRATRCWCCCNSSAGYFYPRSPCGERPATRAAPQRAPKFLSTLSLRRATVVIFIFLGANQFLSTLSLRRATQNACKLNFMVHNFYPRSPCGERRWYFVFY